MIWDEYPEVKLARRILEKHSLSLPFKIRTLLESYATVIFKSIPIEGVSGVAVNIKIPGKTPLVIINQDTTATRQQFTMAHELGHLVIPWHVGIKIDEGGNYDDSEDSYSLLEKEADRFATELLMPSSFVNETTSRSSDLAKAHKEICRRLKVSPQAAAIQISNTLSAGVIYCAVKNGRVTYSGKTKGTPDRAPYRNEVSDEKWYPLAVKRSVWTITDLSIYWWEMVPNLSASARENALDWTKLLNEMVVFIESGQEQDQYKKSINGIISSVNSKKRHTDDYTLESLLMACHQRFDVEEHAALRNHPNFDNFLTLRLQEFLNRGKR